MMISIAMTNDENVTMYFDTTEDTIEYDLEGDVMTIHNPYITSEINRTICETMMNITQALEVTYAIKELIKKGASVDEVIDTICDECNAPRKSMEEYIKEQIQILHDYTNNGVTH